MQAAGGLTPLRPPALLQNFAALGGTGDPAVALLHLVLDGINPRYCQNIRGVRINPLPFGLAWTHHSQAACRLHVKPLKGFRGGGGDGPRLVAKQQYRPQLNYFMPAVVKYGCSVSCPGGPAEHHQEISP